MNSNSTLQRVWPRQFSLKALLLLVFIAVLVIWCGAWEYHRYRRRNFVSMTELVERYNDVIAKLSAGQIPRLTNDELIVALRRKGMHKDADWLPLGIHIEVVQEHAGTVAYIDIDGRHRPTRQTLTDNPPANPSGTWVCLKRYNRVTNSAGVYLLQSHPFIPLNVTYLPPPTRTGAGPIRWLSYGILLLGLTAYVTVALRNMFLRPRV